MRFLYFLPVSTAYILSHPNLSFRTRRSQYVKTNPRRALPLPHPLPLHAALSSTFEVDDDEEYYDDNFDLWGESMSDAGSSSSSISDSTLAEIASDYHFPIDYIAHAVCSWGADPPVDVEDKLGDLVNGEQCFALLEAITTLDPAEVDEAFCAQNISELSSSWGVETGVVFEACVREGLELPFGIRTRLKEEDVESVQRWVAP
mmetsp:Transcript_8957/g.18089  ORF Transcript_8957/g.18089 Transcript_8957/m.18089 type:complete len:203 (-) Transcript_8957:23-631(-)